MFNTAKYSTEEIIECFKEFIKDYPLLIIDNEYTRNYLSDITNKKESLYDYFDIEHKDSIIEELMSKYNIEPTNYIVDIIYESIIRIV